MKISQRELKITHIIEFCISLMLGALMAWSYYMQPLPWLVVGLITLILMKTSMELRRLAKYQGTPLLPTGEETDDSETT